MVHFDIKMAISNENISFRMVITCLGLKVLNMAAFLVLAFSILEYLWNEHE